MTLAAVEFWHWWLAAVVLIVVEVLAPGFFFLWLGIAAAVVGGALLLVPGIGWEIQFLIFAVLSVGSVVLWRIYQRRHPTVSDRPGLNRRGQRYVGRHFTLDSGIVDGKGVLKVGDSRWLVRADQDLPAGTRVQVTGVEGTVLTIERA